MVRSFALQDWDANHGRRTVQIVLVAFRLAQALSKTKGLRLLARGARLLYRLLAGVFLSMELSPDTNVGPRLRIHHGYGLVVHAKTVIGADVELRQSTTIGSRRRGGNAPTIEDGVSIGANAVVIGGIVVGENAIIGAGAVVTKDVPADTSVVGNPAKWL